MGLSVTPDWVSELPFQQQTVLHAAIRGPDGFPKHHKSKDVLRAYRACVMKCAWRGRMLHYGEDSGNDFMTMHKLSDLVTWKRVLQNFSEVEDELPLHYFTHLKHGAQILAYKHPSVVIRERWLGFYCRCCNYLHSPIEAEETMDARLNDWGRENWDAVA